MKKLRNKIQIEKKTTNDIYILKNRAFCDILIVENGQVPFLEILIRRFCSNARADEN